MSRTKSHAKDVVYDVVVVGAGLMGWLAAQRLSSAGRRVALLDAREQILPDVERVRTYLPALFWDRWPIATGTKELWASYMDRLGLGGTLHPMESEPLVFESSRWQRFLGFGGETFPAMDHLLPWSGSAFLQPDLAFDDFVAAVRREFRGDRLERDSLRHIAFEGRAILQTRLGHELETSEVLWCESPGLLLKFAPPDAWTTKDRRAMARNVTWSMAEIHAPCPDGLEADTNLRWIFGKNDKESEAVLGYWRPSRGDQDKVFVGVLPFQAEAADDGEFVGDRVRFCRRQLKRAWPEVFGALDRQRVLVLSDVFGQPEIRLDAGGLVPGLPCLRVVSTDAGHPGLAGFMQAVDEAVKTACPQSEPMLNPSQLNDAPMS
jgi:hypothetical protein